MGRAATAIFLGIALAGHGVECESPAAGAAVTIRTAHLVELPEAARVAARETVRSIFLAGGIEIAWRECASPHLGSAAPADPCVEALAPTEVVVRLAPAPRQAPPGSLGFSYVVQGAGIGRLATVYPDRVAEFARSAATSSSALLGRVIAHEVGHLLLGTFEHAPHGLMRPYWSRRDVAHERSTGAWRFSADEAAAMRRSLQASTR
jgi:hypothetical protein